MSFLPRASEARIDLDALRHNVGRVRVLAPRSRILAMVKADAYGHGLIAVSRVLSNEADGLGVACVPEGLALREAGLGGRIVVMQGCKNAAELAAAQASGLDLVVHEHGQVELLERHAVAGAPLAIWLKIDTGMHRIGFEPEEISLLSARLRRMPAVASELRYVTHFACADDPNAQVVTDRQIERFRAATGGLEGECSLCNSAGVLTRADAHADWVRPGIMLYGASPLLSTTADELGLRPVMTLQAPLIAVRLCRAGEPIGYGGTHVCAHDTRVGIVAIGYGDGYPRHAANGTSVVVGGNVCAVIGRVSMDMLAIDLGSVDCAPGDVAVLWGASPAVEDVAHGAGTISYELLCAAGSKARRVYI